MSVLTGLFATGSGLFYPLSAILGSSGISILVTILFFGNKHDLPKWMNERR